MLAGELNPEDRAELKEMMRSGHESPRVFRRVRVLQLVDGGASPKEAASAVGVCEATAKNIVHRYEAEGLRRALRELDHGHPPVALDPRQKARIIAMVCSSPPRGQARWSIRLIAKHAVKKKIVGSVCKETIRILLLCHDLKPWREKNVVRRRAGRRVRRAHGGPPGPLREAARP